MSIPKIIVIVGPTASGKSGLAVALAKKHNGAVISADSRQIYKGLNIGSGKITKKEMEDVPHYLLDVANPKRIFTVASYKRLATQKLKSILHSKKLPIICGGTGLYIRALIDGLIIPSVAPNSKLRKHLEALSTKTLFTLLKKKDARRAHSIDPHNRRRLIRALEIIETLGKVPELKKNPFPAETLFIGIKKSRDVLQKLIRARLIKRMRHGLIEEVKHLNKNGLQWKRLEALGLEYRYIAEFLRGKIKTKEALIEILSYKIYQYAKRQMTWFSPDERIHWIKNKNEAIRLVQKFLLKTP